MGMARVSFPDERKREVGSREGRGKQRASETERGGEGEGQREREREIFTRKIIEWCSVMVNPIVGSRSIDDRIGKKIVCRVTWRVVNPSGTRGKGKGEEKGREERWFVGYRQIALSARVSSSIASR